MHIYPTFSPFSFADDSPLAFIDEKGNYRISKKDQGNYPQLTNLLKNIKTVVNDNPEIYAAFKAEHGLSDKEA